MKIKEHIEGKRLLQACDYVMDYGRQVADQVACSLLAQSHYLTRLANNQIVQHVRKRELQLVVRVILDGRMGMASCNQLDEGTLRDTVEQAVRLSRYAEALPFWTGFAEPETIPQIVGFDEATEQVTPLEMAKKVYVIAQTAQEEGLTAAGACQVVIQDHAVVNSRGIRLYGRRSKAELHAVVMGETSSGYASDTKRSFYELEGERVATTAKDKCLASQHPIEIEPGTYQVLLEPKAVADLVSNWACYSFNPVPYHEERSFVSAHMGEQRLSPLLTLREAPLEESGLPFPFDWEGQAKRPVTLVEQGKIVGMVYDEWTARKMGAMSTGNAAFPLEDIQGAIPSYLEVEEGTSPYEEMIKRMDRGIVVTRFHYLATVHPKETIMTGMTRDGTFLVENGKIVAPIKNLRMTESVVQALQQIIAVGKESQMISHAYGYCRTPALLIDRFRFTGGTDH
ncbi:TldD/PmbA family protein [Laceyella putida]|uniref:TldD/PmbA family protein n=1 Tax=Laceyella putida TaxID=110101 RepID=A0ABW2RGU0_9BACL